ncbi:type I-E CRISPR-associated protein Cse2/CasB [Microbacterium luticocti]|uniref:type I-E CRISPR-associated protein Cse2/CasB n=1 Tax=Microbacterium luticocti TaxID=451764 RepID=UPI00146F413D|nr:type I-E CRISPR-associated protein Cse2/CasB [Microbacterium luticocti]
MSLGERLATHVSRRASDLQARYRRDDSDAVATLAILRRGVSVPVGTDPRLVGLTIAGLYDGLTQPRRDEPTEAERAAYAAITLFAVHQQSHRDAAMHRRDYSFGRSARLLGRRSGARDAVRTRFTALATATSWDETMHHARGLIQQLRAHSIPLDYGQFARDLYNLQFPGAADRVRLVWGRHFYREHSPDDESDAVDNATDDPGDAAKAS